MRAARLAVHVGGGDVALLGALVNVLVRLVHGLDALPGGAFDEDAALDVLSQRLGPSGAARSSVQQVKDLLVVDLEERAVRNNGDTLLLHLLQARKAVLEDARDEPAVVLALFVALHGVSLAAAGLAIGEDGGVEALERVLGDGLASVQEHGLLAVALGENAVEGEDLAAFAADAQRGAAGGARVLRGAVVGLAVALGVALLVDDLEAGIGLP
mmetsp:Transcript_1459/g.4412  ORF Transcript_1459/g.4412 Transcript_1459/m.4412 type:complete len:213 (+) Transcript_1459:113-751(+)